MDEVEAASDFILTFVVDVEVMDNVWKPSVLKDGNPVIVQELRFDGRKQLAILMGLAASAGCAIVARAKTSEAIVIGTEASVAYLADGWKLIKPAYRVETAAEAIKAACRIYRCTLSDLDPVHQRRAERIDLDGVRHAVVAIYPQLRVWPDESEYANPPEVELRPHHGGLILGGVVWTDMYYSSGEMIINITAAYKTA